MPIVPIRLETTLRRVDVNFNRKLFNTRSTTTTSRLHFGEKKLCRSVRERDGTRWGSEEEVKKEEEEE